MTTYIIFDTFGAPYFLVLPTTYYTIYCNKGHVHLHNYNVYAFIYYLVIMKWSFIFSLYAGLNRTACHLTFSNQIAKCQMK